MEAFEALIFPIWKGIEHKDVCADLKLTVEEIAAGRVLLECRTLHSQDIAIHASGIKPNRTGSDQARMAELRRKAAKSAHI